MALYKYDLQVNAPILLDHIHYLHLPVPVTSIDPSFKEEICYLSPHGYNSCLNFTSIRGLFPFPFFATLTLSPVEKCLWQLQGCAGVVAVHRLTGSFSIPILCSVFNAFMET